MKSVLSILLFILMNNLAQAQKLSIDSLFLQAKTENKKVLLYFSGSDWCAPCIRFKKNFIEKTEFISFADSSLIIYNADFPRKKANQLKKDSADFNETLAEAYNSDGTFPRIILLDATGKILKQWLSLPSESLANFIQSMK